MTVSFRQLWLFWAAVVFYNIVAGYVGLFSNITPMERFHECWSVGFFILAVWITTKAVALTSKERGGEG